MASPGPGEYEEKIKAVLTELKPLEKAEDFDAVLISRVVDPPSYIAAIGLGSIGEFPLLKRKEKSRWQFL